MSSNGQQSFTLILHVLSAQNLSTHAIAAFCTTFVWNNSSPAGPAESISKPKYTSFSHIRDGEPVDWKEEVQIDVTDPKSEVLTIRVKDSSDTLVGSCNIYLAHLRPGASLDQWFQLHPTGHIHLKLMLKPNQRSPNASPYSADFMKRVNESPLPSNIAMLVEMQNHANENTMRMMTEHIRQQQQTKQNFMQAQSQFPYPTGYPQTQGTDFQGMIGTVTEISTIMANMQQLNGNTGGGNGLGGTIASIGLGALGLGPLGAFFGS
ncbi:putative membrane protein [Phytophthora megakarya]|uniref:Putative membrane protein n=1 Tax=Phytophthora megakarya TaxID=4795 RepID=A0A225WJ41_9STRA|nr:putative membrane protein [Phytophthora megakarya]